MFHHIRFEDLAVKKLIVVLDYTGCALTAALSAGAAFEVIVAEENDLRLCAKAFGAFEGSLYQSGGVAFLRALPTMPRIFMGFAPF